MDEEVNTYVPKANLHSHLPIQRLIAIRRIRDDLDREEREAILEARRPFYEDDFATSSARHSWFEIGRALGITRQAAWKKFRHLDESLGIRPGNSRPNS